MSDKINELAKQCGLWHVTDREDLCQEFARLIVKECADIALREDHDPYECILKHFGVEE